MWADAQRDGYPSNVGGAFASSAIPFLVPRHKLWLTPAARVLCSHTANIAERKTWTQLNFAAGKIPVGGNSLQNVYTVYQPGRQPSIVQSLVGFR